MSENNRFAPDADQDPDRVEPIDAQPTGDDVAPDPIEAVGEPVQDDSQADRLREAQVTRDARESADDFGREDPDNRMAHKDDTVATRNQGVTTEGAPQDVASLDAQAASAREAADRGEGNARSLIDNAQNDPYDK